MTSATAVFLGAATCLSLRANATPNMIPSGVQLRALQLWYLTAFLGGWVMILPLAAWEKSQKGEHVLWFVAILVYVGVVWACIAAVRATKIWRRYGGRTLNLEPCPGHVGGVVGGWLEIPMQCSATDRVVVTLRCQHGQDREGAEGTELCWGDVWEQTMDARLSPSHVGMRISFTFLAPGHLPPSKEDHDKWSIIVAADGPHMKFWASYEAPVRARED